MLDIVAYHRCYLLEVHLITPAFDILDFIEKAFNIIPLEVGGEFLEEAAKPLERDLVLSFEEKLE